MKCNSIVRRRFNLTFSTCVIAYPSLKHSISNTLFTCDRWAFEGQNLEAYLGDSSSLPTNNTGHLFEIPIYRTPICFANLISRTRSRWILTFFSGNGARQRPRWIYSGARSNSEALLAFAILTAITPTSSSNAIFENTDRLLAPGGFTTLVTSADGRYARSRRSPPIRQLRFDCQESKLFCSETSLIDKSGKLDNGLQT